MVFAVAMFTVSALCILFAIGVWLTNRPAESHVADAPHAPVEHPEQYDIIHKPAGGCPAGWREVPDIFERNQVKSPACFNPRSRMDPGHFSFDYLMPHEMMHMDMDLPLPKWKALPPTA